MTDMADKLLGEFLILALLLIICGRVFIIKRSIARSGAVLAPITFLLSLIQLFTWGLTVQDMLLCLLSFIILFGNIHALTRLANSLYIDYFSPIFVIFSIIMSICIIAVGAILFYLRPAKVQPEKLHAEVSKLLLYGETITSMEPVTSWKQFPPSVLWTFTPSSDKKHKDPVILFLPDPRAETDRYKPYLLSLAGSGYTLLSADFYTRDFLWFNSILDYPPLRRTALIFKSLQEPETYSRLADNHTAEFTAQFEQLITVARQRFGQEVRFYLITDGSPTHALTYIAQKYPYYTAGIYSIQNNSVHKTPGYGFINATDPVEAWLMGIREFDQDLFMTRYIALKTPIPKAAE